MEIRIDTKKDSHDDIRKMIAFLQKFVGEGNSYGGYDTYSSNNDSNDDFSIPSTNMFDAPPSTPERRNDSDDDIRIIEY